MRIVIGSSILCIGACSTKLVALVSEKLRAARKWSTSIKDAKTPGMKSIGVGFLTKIAQINKDSIRDVKGTRFCGTEPTQQNFCGTGLVKSGTKRDLEIETRNSSFEIEARNSSFEIEARNSSFENYFQLSI